MARDTGNESGLEARWARPGPRRILAIDGGGIRGIIALGFLRRIESLVREQTGLENLASYFNLIAGTSTGSIIAASLALGRRVEEIRDLYLRFCARAFTPSLFGRLSGGALASRFRIEPLAALAGEVFGKTELGDEAVRTGLLIMLQRADTNSPWPIHNSPNGKYYEVEEGSPHLANRRLPIANLVLASCAAPSYFRPVEIEIGRGADGTLVRGLFVDGSVSPHKNPALQALRVATIPEYGFGWRTGEEHLSITSIGTGFRRRRIVQRTWRPAGILAIETLMSLLETCSDEVELMLQWMSRSPSARIIDSEIGNLSSACITGLPAFRYGRFNLPLEESWLRHELGIALREKDLDRLYRLGDIRNLPELDRLGALAAERLVPARLE